MEGLSLTNKRCSACGEHKPVTEFTKDKTRKTGLANRCRVCNKTALNVWYAQNKQANHARNLRWNTNNPTKAIFFRKRRQAKLDGIEFSLRHEDIHFPSTCPVLGVILDYSQGTKNGRALSNSPSFDRIDPTKGYVAGNVIIVSMMANQIKSNATVEQLERVASFYRQLIP